MVVLGEERDGGGEEASGGDVEVEVVDMMAIFSVFACFCQNFLNTYIK